MPEQKSEVFDSLRELFALGREKVSKEISLFFYNCFETFFIDRFRVEEYCKAIGSIYELTQAKGKVVLDLGCGYGLISIIFASLGARLVHGIDISESKIANCKKLLSRFSAIDNLRVDVGDGMRIDRPDAFFNVVIVHDVFSHILNVDFSLSEIKRVLKPKGALYIYESNNALHIPHKMYLRRFWKAIEEGPMDPKNELPKPFREMREEMIKEKFPSIDNEKLGYLSRHTQGMWGEEISKVAEEYLAKGVIPKKRKSVHVNPRTGVIAEHEFNPFKLKKLLEKYGFAVKIIPPYSRYTYPQLKHPLSKNSFSRIVKVATKRILRYFYPISLLTSPQFELLARRKDEL